MMQQFAFVAPKRLIAWGAGAVTACGLLIALGNQASAQDTFTLFTGGVFRVGASLPEGREGISATVGGNTIDFFTPGYGVSDNVTFGPFDITFDSDTETMFPKITPLPGAITRTVKGENAALALRFTSDSDQTSQVGSESDRLELDLITLGNPVDMLNVGTLTETGVGRETSSRGSFDLPEIVITFDEGDGTNSDILAIGPVMIDVTSDGEIPLPATGIITITGESGEIFSIRATSDVPEPGSFAILATALAGLGFIWRRHRAR